MHRKYPLHDLPEEWKVTQVKTTDAGTEFMIQSNEGEVKYTLLKGKYFTNRWIEESIFDVTGPKEVHNPVWHSPFED